MEDKPKFMSNRWQSKLMRDQPVLFWLLATLIALPVPYVLRVGINGGFGEPAQIVFRIVGVFLLLGLVWLVVGERLRRRERNSRIDAYLEQRYEQTHEHGPTRD